MHRKIVKVFLASPGDLKAEREAAHRVVNEINRNSADFWNIQIELIGWEDTVSKFGRAQEVINQELEQCEYFIGIMWQKWGSPPGGDGHPYTSGFEEEFKRSVERREKLGSPEISLLFKAPEESRIEDPGPELSKVLKFRKEIIDSKKILFQDFKEPVEFEARVRALLTEYVQKTLIQERESAAATEARPQSPLAEEASLPQASKRNELLPDDATEFIESILSRSDPDNTVLASDVARLRLIAKTLDRSGNDDETLGAHDANLIYKNRGRFTLSHPEIYGLTAAGLKGLSAENVPLWRWLSQGNKSLEETLAWQYLQGNNTIKANAIKVLLKCDFLLKSSNLPHPREVLIKMWLESKSEEVKYTGMDYLAELGNLEDIQLLQPYLDASSPAVSERALAAAVSIAARSDLDEAFALLRKYPALAVRQSAVDRLFQNPSLIRTDALVECLSNRSSEIRERSFRILCERGDVSKDIATALLADASPSLRNLAFQRLIKTGEKFSLEEARKLLVRTNRNTGGLSGFFIGAANTEGSQYYDEYRLTNLQKLKLNELRANSEAQGLDEFTALYALYSRYYKETFSEIESNLRDGFSAEFKRRIAKLDQDGSSSAVDLIKRIEDQSGSKKREVIEKVLDICCRLGDSRTLEIVRFAIDKHLPSCSANIIAFLEKHGGWEDAKRLAEIGARGRTLLTFSNDEFEAAKAAAILTLGKGRLADVLSMKTEPTLLAEIIAHIPNGQFLALPDLSVIKLLRNKNEKVRKAASLKVIASSPKKRSEALLVALREAREAQYYNVVHWLDFAASAPSALAKKVAMKELIAPAK